MHEVSSLRSQELSETVWAEHVITYHTSLLMNIQYIRFVNIVKIMWVEICVF